MEETLRKYPVLSPDTNVKKRYGKYYSIMNENSSKQVKESGWEVLRYCEGALSVKEIINLLNESWEVSESEVVSFLEKLSKNGFVEFKENKLSRKILVEGNWNNIYPSFCSIQITDRCNLKCIYCYGEFNPGNIQISLIHILIKINRSKTCLQEIGKK